MASAENNKKKTQTKSQKGKTKKSKKKQKTLFDMNDTRTKISIAAVVIAVIFGFIAFFPGGENSWWNNVHTFCVTLGGLFSYFVPPAIIVILGCTLKNLDSRKIAKYTAGGFAAILLIASIVHLCGVQEKGIGFGVTLSEVWSSCTNHDDGAPFFSAVPGALFGGGLYALCRSKILGVLICLALLIADIMILFRIKPDAVIRFLSGIFSSTARKAKPIIEEKKITVDERNRQRRDIREREREIRVRQREMEKRERQREEYRRKSEEVAAEKEKTDRYYNDFGLDTNSFNNSRNTAGDYTLSDYQLQIIDRLAGNEFGTFTSEFSVSSSYSNTRKRPAPIPTEYKPSPISAEEQKKPVPAPIIPTVGVEETKTSMPPIIPMSAPETEVAEPIKPTPAAKPVVSETAKPKTIADELDQGMKEEAPREYEFPPFDILRSPDRSQKYYDEVELRDNGDKLIDALGSFNVSASVSAIVPGPTVTRYELTPAPGVKISKFTGLADDLALCLAAPAGIRIEAPIPNKSAIGVEIPNREKVTITFREVIDTEKFKNAEDKLTVALGKNISGDPIYCNIAKMPHLLVAGTTGSGKSVLMNSMIVSILYHAKPEEVRMILIDPKQVEFGMYNGIPHLLVPVVSDAKKAAGALNWAVTEMLDRYHTFNENRVRDLKGYNKKRLENPELENKPQIVIFIDELADLMIAAPSEVEDAIQRVAQMGRAAGIHLVVATQRPSVDVITGVIKANMSSRIALTVKSAIDSRTIIDASGAEKLTGHGDMLYAPVDYPKPLRVQGCYLSDAEIVDIVKTIKENNPDTTYDESVNEAIERAIPQGKKKGTDFASDASGGGIAGISDDEKFSEVVDFILANPDQVSISSLQRHLRIGFARAGRLIDELLEKGYIQNVEGSKTKKVVLTQNEWYEILAGSAGGAAKEPVQQSMFNDPSAADDIFINPDKVTTVTDEDMGFSGV